MNVLFELETLGYISAEFILEDNQSVKIMHSSDYEDGFQKLLNQLFFFYDIAKNQKSEYFPAKFDVTWMDDFIHYHWNVSIDAHEAVVAIRIIETYPKNPDHSKTLVSGIISFNKLFKAVYQSLDTIYTDFGLLGFKEVWEVGNFPVSEYLLLKSEFQNSPILFENTSEELHWKKKRNRPDELRLL